MNLNCHAGVFRRPHPARRNVVQAATGSVEDHDVAHKAGSKNEQYQEVTFGTDEKCIRWASSTVRSSVPWCCDALHAVDARRLHQMRSGLASFSSLEPSGRGRRRSRVSFHAGEVNMVTQEWRDGLASTIMRRAVNDETPYESGPVLTVLLMLYGSRT